MGVRILGQKDIEYPRHWWFTCNDFTCYVESDENDKITPNSQAGLDIYYGKHIGKLIKYMRKKSRGFMYQEYDKNSNRIYRDRISEKQTS